jgi:cobalt/nickel transport system permease protein
MINIDTYAYSSRLKDVNPLRKLAFSLLTLCVCLWSGSITVSVLILFIMGGLTVVKGGIPKLLYLKLIMLPVGFLMISVFTIAVNVSEKPADFFCSLAVFGTHVGMSRTGVFRAIVLFFKALGAVSCLYFLSLNTPMVDLLGVLRKLKVPRLLIDLMELIYRFIFVFLETADSMITAQNSRLGYSSIASLYRSLAALASTLFIRSYKRSDDIFTALESRGYDGELNVLQEPVETRISQFIMPVVMNLLLILTTLLLRRYMGGI